MIVCHIFRFRLLLLDCVFLFFHRFLTLLNGDAGGKLDCLSTVDEQLMQLMLDQPIWLTFEASELSFSH